ncbi:MAG: cyclic nucleotide-binding domain-containing protein [Oceanococcus sp.]
MAQASAKLDISEFRKLSPINGLREESLQQLFKRVSVLQAKSGEQLFAIGSSNADSYYLLSGSISLIDQSGKVLRELKGSTVDAMHRVAHQIPRRVLAICKSDITYIRIDSGLLDVMLTWDQTGSFEVDELDENAESGDWMTRLLQMKAFQKVPPSNLQAMFMRMQQVEHKAGDVIVKQGSEGDYFYVIITGCCVVTRETPTSPKPIRLADLEHGACFGEEALISDDKRNASVIMVEDGTLMRLAKDDFRSLLKAPLTQDLALDEAKALVENSAACWLDVRLPSEYKNNHFEGAINLPLFMLRPKLATLDKKTPYVVYCDGGRRSSVAAFVLTQKGYEVKVLSNGIPPLEVSE